jgi:hypothetical protein
MVAKQLLNKDMKTYRTSTEGLTSAPEALVTFRINGVPVTMLLGDMAKWMKENKLTHETIRDARVNGIETGIFPVIKAKTEKAAEALSSVLKSKTKKPDVDTTVPVGDGWRFTKQSWARDIYVEIRNLGVGLDELVMEWQLGQPKGASAKQLQLPLQPREKFTEAQRLAAYDDAPPM